MVSPATTSLVQPVDNAPFKAEIDKMATAHLQENLDDYVQGKINASARRVQLTKWVGQAWEDIYTHLVILFFGREKLVHTRDLQTFTILSLACNFA